MIKANKIMAYFLLVGSVMHFTTANGRLWVSIGAVFCSAALVLISEGLA